MNTCRQIPLQVNFLRKDDLQDFGVFIVIWSMQSGLKILSSTLIQQHRTIVPTPLPFPSLFLLYLFFPNPFFLPAVCEAWTKLAILISFAYFHTRPLSAVWVKAQRDYTIPRVPECLSPRSNWLLPPSPPLSPPLPLCKCIPPVGTKGGGATLTCR